MKSIALGLLIAIIVSACGSENAENEKNLSNLVAAAKANGTEPNWVLWMQLKELPRKPDRWDELLHLFDASGLHSFGLPKPVEIFNAEADCVSNSISRTGNAGDHFTYFCRPIGHQF